MILSFDNQTATVTYGNSDGKQILPVSVPLASLHKVLFDSLHREISAIPALLPSSIRWMSSNGTKFVVERPPCVIPIAYHRGIAVTQAHSEEVLQEFAIAIPWQVYYIDVSHETLSCFFRNAPISTLKSTLVSAPLTNVGEDGRVCLGKDAAGGFDQYQEKGGAIGSFLTQLIQFFWTTTFNDEISINYGRLPPEMQLDQLIHERACRYASLNPAVTEPNDPILHHATVDPVAVYTYLSQRTVEDICTLRWGGSTALEQFLPTEEIPSVAGMVTRAVSFAGTPSELGPYNLEYFTPITPVNPYATLRDSMNRFEIHEEFLNLPQRPPLNPPEVITALATLYNTETAIVQFTPEEYGDDEYAGQDYYDDDDDVGDEEEENGFQI